MVHDLVRPGLVVVGDAAGLTLNTGLTVRGMDLAAGSAIAAAKVDPRGAGGRRHLRRAAGGLPGGARRGLRRARPAHLREGAGASSRRGGCTAPTAELAADVLHGVFDLDTYAAAAPAADGLGALRRSPVKLRQVAARRHRRREGPLMLDLGSVAERLARNKFDLDEASHIELDQALARSTGTGALLVRACPAHVYTEASGRDDRRPARGLPRVRDVPRAGAHPAR